MSRISTVTFGLFFLVGAGLTLAAGFFMNFHAAGNDIWSPLYYGRHISLAQPESLYNGFYPIGYSLLIGQFPYSYAIQLAYLLNALFVGLLTACITSVVSTTRSLTSILLAFIFSVLLPLIFVNANTVGPDIGAAAFTACAIYLLWIDPLTRNKDSHSYLKSGLTGLCLGLAVLWRNHAIVSSIVILVIYLLMTGSVPLRHKLMLACVFIAVCSFQVFANMYSGHGPFETAQNFNIYKLFHGVDWTNPPAPAEIEGFSLWTLLLANPSEFFQAYYPWFIYLATFAWPGLTCVVLSPWKSPTSRFGIFTSATILIYSIPLSLGDSLRAPLTTIALYIAPLGISFSLFLAKIRDGTGNQKWVGNVSAFGILTACAFTAYGWFQSDWDLIKSNRAEHKIFLNVEQTLIGRGMISPTQVFSDRLDFYLPNQPPYLPRQIEGFFYYWVWGYSREYPRIQNESWESFASDCRAQGIKFLVLSPNASYRGDYFPPIYSGDVDPEENGLSFIAQRGNFRIYQFKE